MSISGLSPKRCHFQFQARSSSAIAGWGHKKSAAKARLVAQALKRKYLAFEDGFLRSVVPGPSETSLSLVMDGSGIYYDARQSSDLETLLNTVTINDAEKSEVLRAIGFLKDNRLSKYNHAPLSGEFPEKVGKVLVIDQTLGDASISGGLADETSFRRMLECAQAEHPGEVVVVKLHPEVVSGQKQGYLANLVAADDKRIRVIGDDVNPWDLLAQFSHIYTVSSQFGFEALMAGKKVTCFGVPFYAGWGLTDDRGPKVPRRQRTLSLVELVYVTLFRYCHYFDAYDHGVPTDFWTAVGQLKFLRDHYQSQKTPLAIYKVADWKRRHMVSMLRGIAGTPKSIKTVNDIKRVIAGSPRKIAAWGKTARRLREAGTIEDGRLVTIEDGFMRSVGLGASFTASLSFVFDDMGIYYDPSRPSRLEKLLNDGNFSPEILEQAANLKAEIIKNRLSKYNLAEQDDLSGLDLAGDKKIIVVPGQVADDESVRLGARSYFEKYPLSEGGANKALLEMVRARHQNGFIVYKPHPDVSAGLRAGAIADKDMTELADLVMENIAIDRLFEKAHSIETMTSLAGFEALLRGVKVVCHGLPFYAGWGLSEDLNQCERRKVKRNIDELLAAALILYPLYCDPVSHRACPASVALQRILQQRKVAATNMVNLTGYCCFFVAYMRNLMRLNR